MLRAGFGAEHTITYKGEVDLLTEIDERQRTIEGLDADPDCRAIVITGGERAFAAGVDIRQLVQLLEKSNFSVGAGQVTGHGERFSVRPLGEFWSEAANEPGHRLHSTVFLARSSAVAASSAWLARAQISA